MGKQQTIPRETVRKLNENPNVKKATEWTVSFTAEFKQQAYDEYYAGKSMRQIFTEAGLDVEQLGDRRLENFLNRLLAKASQENGFEDGRKRNSRKEPQSTEAQMAKRIRELEHRNAYLEQENEFLKKYNHWKRAAGGRRQSRSDHAGKV